MTEKKFDFWQDHSMKYLEMAWKTDRMERIENPDGYGTQTVDCGDGLEIFLSVDKNRVKRVSFASDGCLHTRACANALASLAEGLKLEMAQKITPTHVMDILETLPPHEAHCAEMAVDALQMALADHTKKTA